MEALAERRWAGIVLAAVLFAAIFALRVTVGSLADAIGLLYVIPVVLVATIRGTRAGLLAGAVAFLLSSLGALIVDAPSSLLGYVNRAAVYLFVGGLTGRFATSLRALEAESARHFNLSLDMICIAGFDGRFKHVNPAFERCLGYRPEELVGRPFLDFVHPDDREPTERETAAISDGEGTVHFRNRYIDRSGEVHWLEWTSAPLADEGLIYAVARDITERKMLELELERLSQHDPLTGLFNRRRFEEELRRQLAYTRRYGKGGALLMVDLDRFKQINDDLGHAVGDRALCHVAELLSDNLRATDLVARDVDPTVARLGGDEFVVLLPEADGAGAEAAAARLVAAVGKAPLPVEDRQVELRVSIGVATFDEDGIPGEQELLAAADRAMYLAKASGGDGARLAASPS
jgi:diguanylate cyclase (GGDEF)-like protein/PAS domain S-box-containing protein